MDEARTVLQCGGAGEAAGAATVETMEAERDLAAAVRARAAVAAAMVM